MIKTESKKKGFLYQLFELCVPVDFRRNYFFKLINFAELTKFIKYAEDKKKSFHTLK